MSLNYNFRPIWRRDLKFDEPINTLVFYIHHYTINKLYIDTCTLLIPGGKFMKVMFPDWELNPGHGGESTKS